MLRIIQSLTFGLVACALVVVSTHTATAGTIIKLTLGNVSPDIEFDGTTLSTADDGGGSAGDQNTAIDFLGFLEAVATDVLTNTASFTIDGLTASGTATVFSNSLVLQNFTGGTFSLYDPSDALLLSGTLADSALSGPLGFSAGSLFTTSFGNVTGGSLQQYIDPNSVTLSMSFTEVRSAGGGVGFAVTPNPVIPLPGPITYPADLHGFTADATIIIEAQPIPEPWSLAIVLVVSALIAAVRRSRWA